MIKLITKLILFVFIFGLIWGGMILPPVQAAQDFVIIEDDGTMITGMNNNNQWSIDEVAVVKKFYETNLDNYDFLAIYTDFPLALQGSRVVRNNTKGIGLETYYGTDEYDLSSSYGSAKLLDISMLGLSTFPMDYNYMLDRSLLLHELAHYWGIYVGGTLGFINVNFMGHYNPSGHMGFGSVSNDNLWFDTGGDTLGGRDVIPNGDGTWRWATPSGNTTTIPNILSNLTLYLMGFISPSEVAPMSLIRNVDETNWARITGNEQIITIEDIIREHGNRAPSYQTSAKDFSVGYILLTQKGKTPSADSLKQVQDNLESFPFYWAKMTRCHSTMSSNLAKTNRQTCQPISSTTSTAVINPSKALINIQSAATLTITLRDAQGNVLPNRDLRIIPDQEGNATIMQVMEHFDEVGMTRYSRYGFVTTDQNGQVNLALNSKNALTYSYFIVADGEYLSLKPKVEFVTSIPTPIYTTPEPTAPQTTPSPTTTAPTTPTSSSVTQFVQQERAYVTQVDTTLVNRLNGYILLQVQERGEAWYVDSVSDLKYYLPDGSSAYSALRKFGLGITNSDLSKIPVGIESRFQNTDTDSDGLADKLEEGLGTNPLNPDSDGDGYSDGTEVINGYSPLNYGGDKVVIDNTVVNRLKGRILLQVQSRGEAWYLNPKDGKRYYMKDGGAAYEIMRYLSLGITNSDLRTIPVGSL